MRGLPTISKLAGMLSIFPCNMLALIARARDALTLLPPWRLAPLCPPAPPCKLQGYPTLKFFGSNKDAPEDYQVGGPSLHYIIPTVMCGIWQARQCRKRGHWGLKMSSTWVWLCRGGIADWHQWLFLAALRPADTKSLQAVPGGGISKGGMCHCGVGPVSASVNRASVRDATGAQPCLHANSWSHTPLPSSPAIKTLFINICHAQGGRDSGSIVHFAVDKWSSLRPPPEVRRAAG